MIHLLLAIQKFLGSNLLMIRDREPMRLVTNLGEKIDVLSAQLA